MSRNVDQIAERLRREAEEKTAADLAAARARRAERRQEWERRREDAILHTAMIMAKAEAEPDRAVTGACVICGHSRDLPDHRVKFAFGAPLGAVIGAMCSPCHNTRGSDWAERITRRLWAERPDLPKSWGWKRPPTTEEERGARALEASTLAQRFRVAIPTNAANPADIPTEWSVPRHGLLHPVPAVLVERATIIPLRIRGHRPGATVRP